MKHVIEIAMMAQDKENWTDGKFVMEGVDDMSAKRVFHTIRFQIQGEHQLKEISVSDDRVVFEEGVMSLDKIGDDVYVVVMDENLVELVFSEGEWQEP